MQVETFLARFPPFDTLTPEQLGAIARSTSIEYFSAGTTILSRDGPPSAFLYVVRTGSVELLDDGTVVDLLEEGEWFGYPSLLGGTPPAFSVRALDDTICYLIDGRVAADLIRTPAGVAFLVRGLVRRERQLALASEAAAVARPEVEVGTLIHRPPVVCDPTTTVAEATRTMAAERVSSIVVIDGRPVGMFTDRDLRTSVVAEGRDASLPIADVMSSPVISVAATTSSTDALLVMLQHGFHHLPVTDDGGALIGVVSDTDLMGLERSAPFALLRTIDRARSGPEVADAMTALPDVVRALVDADSDPVDIGHVIASAVDEATKRLIRTAIDDLGDPPGAWAWIGLGSQARHEQSLSTDQDHALVYEAPEGLAEDADRYFASVATVVTDGLAASGIPRCRGGVMAENPAWRADRSRWLQTYREQLASIDAEGTVFSSIALDHRRIAGGLDVEPEIGAVVREVARGGRLVRRLGSAALATPPPTGFFRAAVLRSGGSRDGTLDVKHGGITAITNIARAVAVSSGSSAIRTLDRLHEATGTDLIDEDLADGLEEAFRLLWRIRLRHQVDRVAAGREPDDGVDPRQLGPLTRRGLKEAFRLIAAAQRMLSATLGLVR